MLKLVSFHIQVHLNAFLQILEYFFQICLRPLARESPCTILKIRNQLSLSTFSLTAPRNVSIGRHFLHKISALRRIKWNNMQHTWRRGRCKQEHNMTVDLQEKGFGSVDWIQVAHKGRSSGHL